MWKNQIFSAPEGLKLKWWIRENINIIEFGKGLKLKWWIRENINIIVNWGNAQKSSKFAKIENSGRVHKDIIWNPKSGKNPENPHIGHNLISIFRVIYWSQNFHIAQDGCCRYRSRPKLVVLVHPGCFGYRVVHPGCFGYIWPYFDDQNFETFWGLFWHFF